MILWRLKYPLNTGVKKKTEANWITILHVCETETAIAELPEHNHTHTHLHTHTHTNLCDHLKKITLLCMGCVTSIEQNIIEKHHTEEEEST